MSWLLDLLVDAVKEMVSQFIIDMMGLITDVFTDLLSCNLSLFEELFSVVGSLYQNVIVPMGIALLLMILIWQLFKSMFGKVGINAEEGKVQGLNRPRDGGYYDDALMPTTRNKRDVWLINTVPYKGAHFAAFPPKLAETCILAGCPKGGIVIDPFFGSGTTGFAAKSLDRHYIGIELNAEYCALARARIGGAGLSSN